MSFLYHFSDGVYQVEDLLPIGSYGRFVRKQGGVLQDFEDLMEGHRITLASDKPSRLDCLFAFSKKYADTYKTDRKFLYVLEPKIGSIISTHNYNVGTYFWNRIKFNDIELLKMDENLMKDYWQCPEKYLTSEGLDIGSECEFLLNKAPSIVRVINWH